MEKVVMRIQFEMEGGLAYFPGLAKPIVIDTDQLSDQAAMEIEKIVAQANFFALSKTVGKPAPGAADYRQYTITIQDGKKSHTVTTFDPIQDPKLQALVQYLQTKARS